VLRRGKLRGVQRYSDKPGVIRLLRRLAESTWERPGQAKKDHAMVPMRGRLRRVDRVSMPSFAAQRNKARLRLSLGLPADGNARAIYCAGCRLMPNFESVVSAIRAI
jgi:hypothetical protein